MASSAEMVIWPPHGGRPLISERRTEVLLEERMLPRRPLVPLRWDVTCDGVVWLGPPPLLHAFDEAWARSKARVGRNDAVAAFIAWHARTITRLLLDIIGRNLHEL